MFEKAILDFLMKSEYYSKYEKLFNLWQKNPEKYKCAVSTPEMMLETIVRNTLESAIESDNIVHQKEGTVLDRDLMALEDMINNTLIN